MTVTHGFELLREQEIPEINTRARLYRHVATGAELLSLENQDENKVFGITFRTPPEDDTGLPHILEHSVLCGSRKYPVKEPFVELLKGSMQTFLNAFTYPDKTCYPVASQNLKDFYNLVDVYLDAVFYPRLTPEVLQQEGWHYELEQLDQPLIYKGVVFNEMKGSNASPERMLYRRVQSSLYPDTPYGKDSGGDPAAIPDLTFDQFKRFHENYYHPSNARIFFYGDDDPTERLRLLDEYLRDFERREVDSELPLQPLFQEPRRVEGAYPVSPDETSEKKGMVTVNWLLCEPVDFQEILALNILEYILIGAPASPLRKALIESGLGEDLAGYGLIDLRQFYFSAGLKGVDVQDAEKIEKLILDTLASLARGIDRKTVEAALNSTEFSLRENNSGSYPRGLVLMMRVLTSWLYEGDPIAPLAFEGPLNALKVRIASGEPLFEEMIQRYFLQNPHRSTVVLRPDTGLSQQMEERERARLAEVRAQLSEAELQRIIEETRALKLAQETPDSPEALATIPRLELEDLNREIRTIPIEPSEQAGSKVLFHDLFTNGILYLDLGLNLHALPQELLPLVPLFGRALLEMGTEQEDFVRLSQRIDRTTGGIRPTTHTTVVRGKEQASAWLFLRGKAMMSQVDDLFAILRDVLLTARLDDRERFRQMVLEEKAGAEAGLIPMGHRVINRRLRAHFTEADWAEEQLGGISQLFFLRRLAEQVESDWPTVLDSLERLRRILLNRNAMIANVTLDEENWQQLQPRLAAFLDSLPAAPVEFTTWSREPAPSNEGLTIPAQVNYVGKAANLYELGYELDGSAIVVTRYLRTGYLWDRIRVQGGAYGAFSPFDTRTGNVSFLSYRDPNLLGTLEVYDRAGAYLREAELHREEVALSIVGTIGEMDSYQLPDAKGFTSLDRYLAGITDEVRQALREEVLATTAGDFRTFAEMLDLVKEQGRIVVLGSQANLETLDGRLSEPLQITKVL